MNEEVKPLFPVLSPIMSVSFHPPVATIAPNGMAISLLFGDFGIELNKKNGLLSAYKTTTYSFTMDNPYQETSIIIRYALNKTSNTAKAFMTFLSNIECFNQEVIAFLEEDIMSTQSEIKILIPPSDKKEYYFALSLFATREQDDELEISIDSIDIANSNEST
ncbi:hypothetical protein RCF98_08065 [Thiothrix lacustris]|uniref:Uncharacterized protein n=1 Tax=Thiothrix lacustris TaxID=525917 RepID=A0ABY9MUD6_9GAMM|nr:hypothetical protein [Thiothrix lacustris]WML92284.1 hypothetical protein RCF98_08065 [Thiothrix lacustris]